MTPQLTASLLLTAKMRVDARRFLGDVAGHEFHGNQWTSGFSVPDASSDPAPGGKFYYHSTSVDNLESIKEHGLKPRGGLGGPVSLSPHLDSVQQWSSDVITDGRPVAVLRIARKHAPGITHEEGYDPKEATAEVHTFSRVPPDWIEVYRAGSWKYLVTQKLKTAASRDNTPLHRAADKHLEAMHLAVWYAFAKGRKAYKSSGIDSAVKAIREALTESLPPVLLKTMVAGAKTLRAAGDVEGHPFHGNQYTQGSESDQLKAIDSYGNYGFSVNSILREKTNIVFQSQGTTSWKKVEKAWSPDKKQEAHEMTKALDEAFTNPNIVQKTQEATTVYRGVADEAVFNQMQDAAVGSTFQDKAFLSTTTTQKEGERFTKGFYTKFPGTKKTVLLHIELPKGTPYLKGRSDEKEWILNRGQHFQILKTETSGKRMVVHARLVENRGAAVQIEIYEFRTAKTIPIELKTSFTETDLNAIKWAKAHAAELAKDISETSRDRIKAAVAGALEGDELGDDILDAVGSKARAEMIARTEIMSAVNEGQREGWNQAVESGLLTGDEQRVWIATSGCCDACDELDGETADLDGEYPEPGGEGPPLHPNCRCTEGLQ